MRKYVLSIFLLLIAASAFCQKKTTVTLIKSKESYGVGKNLIKVYLGTFKQDYSTLTSDSAYFYPQDNAFDAFGHVIINQGDTLNVYSDKLNYNGNTKIAILTDNVRLVDKDATLITNHLTYNTATKIGTYTDGGKLINKDNTLVSKNGYYFAGSHDSYFRYNVSLTTSDALVKTDTMRYNTNTKICYFYGPTNIYGTKADKGSKGKDTLYTENGTYNTNTEQAAFGKNNLYHSGTRSLKGDSLFYDKIKGYGRAVKHVVFIDLEQKTVIKGNLGLYFKPEERTLVTQDPYITIVTEQKDTTKRDSLTRIDSLAKADSVAKKTVAKAKGTGNMQQLIKNTVPGKGDTVLNTRKFNPELAKQIAGKSDTVLNTRKFNPELAKQVAAKADSVRKSQQKSKIFKPTQQDTASMESLKAKLLKPGADTTFRKLAPDHAKGMTLKGVQERVIPKLKTPGKKPVADTSEKVMLKDTNHVKRDTVYMSADTIETQILTYKDLKIYQEKQRLAHIRDTSARPKKKVAEKPSKFIYGQLISGIAKDTTFLHKDALGKPKPKPVRKIVPSKKQLLADSLRKKEVADSIALAKKYEPADTARIRIVIGHHHFKMFKSDLQAKSDSMFYASSDSTIRCYVSPMLWSQGSQLSGDTIYLKMKNKKMDNMTMFPHAFIVNLEKKDSVHFNQIGGKRMRGFFKDDKLRRLIINGNAESIYFVRDSGKTEPTTLERSLSTDITVDFKNNEATNIGFYKKPEHNFTPIEKTTEDDKILKGFIWKPKDRPISKESILPSYGRKMAALEAKNKPKTDSKAPPKKGPDGKGLKDTTSKKASTVLPGVKAAKDSVGKTPLKPAAGSKAVVKDSTGTSAPKKPTIKSAKDSTAQQATPPSPAIKAPKDTVKKPGS